MGRELVRQLAAAGCDVATCDVSAETMAEIEWTAWNDQIVPEIERMKGEFLPAGTVYVDPNQQVRADDRSTTRVVYTGLFTPGPDRVSASMAMPCQPSSFSR